ncbi:MAG: hypothetical protein IPN76_22420 [Saprospiraceae bacterium]|nr:hypothetical protein [Saprospiraceae bacterium]
MTGRIISTVLLGLAIAFELTSTCGCKEFFPKHSVHLDSLNNVLLYSVMAHATISSNDFEEVTEAGFCWNETGDPTILDNVATIGAPATKAINGAVIDSLAPNKTYFVKTFIKGDGFVKFSNELEVQTWDGEVTDIEGNVYKGVQIGNQGWLAECLRCTKYPDGSPIDIGSGSNRIYWYGSGHQYVPGFDTDIDGNGMIDNQDSLLYVEEYGLLYSWYAANNFYDHKDDPSLEGKRIRPNVRDICPIGFHIPTYNEFQDLRNYLGQIHTHEEAGLHLISATGWKDGLQGLDTYGFNFKPGGYWIDPDFSQTSNLLGRVAIAWLSTDGNPANAESWGASTTVGNSYIGKGIHALCVRCIKDQ